MSVGEGESCRAPQRSISPGILADGCITGSLVEGFLPLGPEFTNQRMKKNKLLFCRVVIGIVYVMGVDNSLRVLA